MNRTATYSPVPHLRECSTIVRRRRINFSVLIKNYHPTLPDASVLKIKKPRRK